MTATYPHSSPFHDLKDAEFTLSDYVPLITGTCDAIVFALPVVANVTDTVGAYIGLAAVQVLMQVQVQVQVQVNK